ncbi:diguanylate cyclase domain-containing protein [Aquibacillus kalidii]|uniref:diguanylate cyclase domain-containing protein n=1 Tax=Aquibacillus kalidii TaxID=2762597 RepID=UPI0016493A04|nr:diguanylate cyclase [Aquibacillus kalidii]
MIISLFRDLVANLAIFTSSIILINTIFSNASRLENFYAIEARIFPLKDRIIIGVVEGIVGSLVMLYGFQIDNSGVLVDLRHFSIMLSAMFGGLPAALITGSIMALFRYTFINNIDIPSLYGAMNAVNMSIGCGLIVTFVKSKRRWIYILLYCLISTSIMGIVLIDAVKTLIVVLAVFWLIGIMGAFFIYRIVNYLIKASYSQEKTRINEERLRLITENMSDGITVMDTTATILYASPSTKSFGLDLSKIKSNRDLMKRIHPEDIRAVCESFLGVIKTRAEMVTEFRWEYPVNNWVYKEMVATPVTENGKVSKVVLVTRDITERKNIEHRLAYLSNVDGLTGVANRRFFDQALTAQLTHAKQTKTDLSLLLFDIDHFKLFNDIYGHLAGDQTLKKITEAIEEMMDPSSVFARYGGEEFAVILPQNTRSAKEFAEKLRKRVEQLEITHLKTKKGIVSISIGIASVQHSINMLENDLIDLADKALYQAKNNGRNQVSVHKQN